jgi:hypothetical protein
LQLFAKSWGLTHRFKLKNMELQEFITSTLVQITKGVLEAQKELKDTGCLINPEGFTMEGGQIKRGYENRFRAIQKVKMNVLLNVSENEGSKKGIGVAQVLTAGFNSENSTSNNKQTSVEFEIPIAFPVMEDVN